MGQTPGARYRGGVREAADQPGGPLEPDSRPRRGAVLEATARVLVAEGPRSVTHRRVAREADVPLAATTYYFSSKDDLLEEALRLVAGRELELLERRAAELGPAFTSPGALGRALAAALVDQVERERDSVLTKFDVYLESARRPALRAASRRWIEGFTQLAASALEAAGTARPADAAELLVAGADGLLMHHLATSGRNADTKALRARLERLADTLTTAGASAV